MVDSTLKGMFGGGESEGGNQGVPGSNPLAGLFGGGDPNEDRAGAEDFINRVKQGAPDEGFSEQEALSRLAQASQRATPEQMQRAAQQAVGRMDESQRADFAKMLQERMGGVDRRPADGGGVGMDDLAGMLGQLFSGGGGLGGMLGGLMGGDQGTSRATERGDSTGGGMGDLFGGLLNSRSGKAALGGLAAFALAELLDGKR